MKSELKQSRLMWFHPLLENEFSRKKNRAFSSLSKMTLNRVSIDHEWKTVQQSLGKASTLELIYVSSFLFHLNKLDVTYIDLSSFLAEAEVEYKHSYVTETSIGKPITIRSDSNCTSSGTTSETEDLNRTDKTDGRLIYRGYVEKALKSNGLRKMLR